MFQSSLQFAKDLDANDSLASYRDQFHFPKTAEGEKKLYFTGNSLGLQPLNAKNRIGRILDEWADYAVDGHFYSEHPWWDYHERMAPKLAKVVGAEPSEVTIMNTLTANLHFLMVSFYRPTSTRYAILCEEKAFPSDQYLMKSQLKFHGFDFESALIEVSGNGSAPTTEDFVKAIEENKDRVALILLGGVNYYTAGVLDIETITRVARSHGITIGWDLAHAAGNISLKLHDWGVDFAAWCSYKYMNAGPGSLSGVFIHKRHHDQSSIPRFEGWWGVDKSERFQMNDSFKPAVGAEAWQLSNVPILALAPYDASLDLFEEVGMASLTAKSKQLTDYLEFKIREIAEQTGYPLEIITPQNRGAQLSIYIPNNGRAIFDHLCENGVVPDWRNPNVIRVAPAPFYNSFEDVYLFAERFKDAIYSTDSSVK
ncbi:MAG: kynureninase [Flavobacteriaceae bacterium]|nr:kynureninase [Flavobacteriaceae bacterium]